jgi:hypothetical protein
MAFHTLGHYTYLGAKGPGVDLYYTENGSWTANQSEALIFGSVIEANGTAILGLPAGYKPVLIQAYVERPTPPPGTYSPC